MPGPLPLRTKRVLIYRLGSLGDTVVALPSLHLVERTFPTAERRMLTNFPVTSKAPAAAEVLGDSGLVHGYFRYPAGTRNPFVLLRLLWTILRWRPQVLVYLAASRGIASARRDVRFFRLCGISQQIGVPLTGDMQQNRPQSEHNVLEPEAERLARNLSSLGDAHLDSPASWDLRLTPAEHSRATDALAAAGSRPILAIAVGTKRQSKDWGIENWEALLRLLAPSHAGYALVLDGSPADAEASERAATAWRAAAGPQSLALNLCGHLTLRESAAALTHASLFLGLDSGPMHLAAAVGTPCVVVFSARTLPRVWFPYGLRHRILYRRVECMGCRLETCIVERRRCLTSISPAQVADEVQAALPEL